MPRIIRQKDETTLVGSSPRRCASPSADLKLDELHIVYPGEKRYPLTKYLKVVPLAEPVNAGGLINFTS
jgi:hypothetical protein